MNSTRLEFGCCRVSGRGIDEGVYDTGWGSGGEGRGVGVRGYGGVVDGRAGGEDGEEGG